MSEATSAPIPTQPDAPAPEDDPIGAVILDLTQACGPGASICPSEVARALSTPPARWQSLLTPVRRAAARLAASGRIEILRKGKPVDPAGVRGVIRLRAIRAQA